ncbi:FAD dependent oxidoreductase [Apiospora arundinis]|uniref:Cloroperoxidase n=1 Tax=Apiospora arundinis TaxID=335852 RepID=A0ABR2J4Q7_9PEZI
MKRKHNRTTLAPERYCYSLHRIEVTMAKLAAIIVSATLCQAYSFHHWRPPRPGDLRAPCPMMNTLANHGILPHDGKNIDLNTTIGALGMLNLEPELAGYLFDFGLLTNPEPDPTTFTLQHLGNHNILEHDASFSRKDSYFGQDPSIFDAATFAETRSYWHGPIIDINTMARARMERLKTSVRENPDYSMSKIGTRISLDGSVAILLMFGDGETLQAPKEYVTYFFENERLPIELGWTPPQRKINKAMVAISLQMLVNTTNAIATGYT